MDKDKVAEPKWEYLCRDHKGILCKCYCGRGTHQLLAAGERVLCHGESIQEILEVYPPTQQSHIQYDDILDSFVLIAELLGGDLKKKALNTIPFTLG